MRIEFSTVEMQAISIRSAGLPGSLPSTALAEKHTFSIVFIAFKC